MEKRNYVKPLLNSEEFIPNEYVAACGCTGGGTIYGWAFQSVTNSSGLSSSSNPSGKIIPSPTDVNNVSDLFNLGSSSSISDTLKGYANYGWNDNDNNGKLSSGDQITYTYTANDVSYTAAATINEYNSNMPGSAVNNGLTSNIAANPSASTLNVVPCTKNHS